MQAGNGAARMGNLVWLEREITMKRTYLCLIALMLAAGAVWAQGANVDPGWDAFIIRNGNTTASPPNIVDRPDIGPGAIEIQTWEGGQKAALGTNLLNGATVAQVGELHIDRLDNVATSGSPWGPYFNIWITDGAGHYAVIANEPSDGAWAADRWYSSGWAFLQDKVCKVYDTPGWNTNTSWVHTYAGATSLVFADVADLVIAAPPAAYILNPANSVGTGAPREFGTNVAYGYNWMFGDTATNYVSGGNGFIVDNYYVTVDFPVMNVTQGIGYFTIQAAVDAANSGDAITVGAGHFVEQVHVTVDNLSITGAGAGLTFIDSPTVLPLAYTTSAANKAVVFVDHADGVALADLTVDGLGRGNSNYRFQGIAYWNAGGSVTNVDCLNIIDTPFSGAQHGVGIYGIVTDASSHAIALTDVLVDDFQKTAVVIAGAGLTADLTRVTTVGQGPTGVTAQNGIQVSGGASADLADCDVVGMHYTGANWTASGLLFYGPGTTNCDGCTVDASQSSVYFIDGSGSFANGSVTNPTGDAFYAYSQSTAKSFAADRRQPQPMDEGLPGAPNKAAMVVSITGSDFIGAGAVNSWGPSAYTDDPMTFTMNDCEVSGWDYGIVVYNYGDAVIDATVTGCNIHDNLSYGLYSNAAEIVEAACNWWGDDSGPNFPGNASPGDDVSTGVTIAPWLDAIGGACVLYGDNNVGVGDAPACVTSAATCVSLPVTFNRLDTTASRGVSVTFQLSPELVLCAGNPYVDITMATGAGAWSDGFGNALSQVVDNGGGSYTMDLAILGTPCGPVTGGTLFYVNVKPSPAVTTEAIGTVAVTAVTVRDCANAPLAGIPGAVGEVAINLTTPAALAGLVAAQDKDGNDSDGTTKIDLAWTAVTGDADFITIWRKGYGDYPEYNDGTGAVPVGPVTAGNGWTLVATLPATSTGYADEPATRDFWYYAAYVADECGNTSPASAITGGTLNYHLGDVSDGTTPGAGNNLVGTEDISLLGGFYGVTLAPYGDAHNYLDVGPTTDYSVDARPTTDNRIQFEDLMVFAMNYDEVSKFEPNLVPADANAIALAPEAAGAVGSTFDVAVVLAANGKLQGLSVPLLWDAAVLEPVGMSAGDLLSAYGGQALVLSPEPGTVDAALMGVREKAIAGQGILATVTFRVLAEGNTSVTLGNVTARDKDNRPLVMNGAGNGLPPVSLPSLSELRANVPNPFNPSTEFSFVLAKDGPVSLRVYSVRGELVRTLVDESMAAGPHSLTWNGLDDQGRQAASGAYVVRFIAPDRTQSRQVMLLK